MCSSTPDTSGINRAAEANANVAQEALDWYKQQYNDQAPLRQQAIDTAGKVSAAQLKAMGVATDQAQKDAAYREQVFQPLERGIVSDAENYDTSDRENQAAGRAIGDVTLASANARQEGARSLTRSGVNPSDGAYGAMERATDINTTLAQADAANKARLQVQSTGRAMKADAANLGRGLPSQQAAEQSIALNAGNAGVATGVTPITLAQQGTDQVGRGFSTAISGNNSAGNLYGSAANIQNQASQSDNAIWGALGNVAGASIMKFSDEDSKEDVHDMKGEIALSAVRKIQAKSWRYKRGSRGDDGGKLHVGPMAQDVHAALGEAAAPGGKMINRDSVGDVTLAAVQALDKKVSRLEKRKAH
jgi:hypothetical protein